MYRSLLSILTVALALILSLLAALFFVFNLLFSDISSTKEYLNGVAYVFVGYLGLGGFLGFLRSGREKMWFWLLAIPASVIIVLMAFSEPGRPLYTVAVFLASVGGSWLGPRFAGALRRRFQKVS